MLGSCLSSANWMCEEGKASPPSCLQFQGQESCPIYLYLPRTKIVPGKELVATDFSFLGIGTGGRWESANKRSFSHHALPFSPSPLPSLPGACVTVYLCGTGLFGGRRRTELMTFPAIAFLTQVLVLFSLLRQIDKYMEGFSLASSLRRYSPS